jgi:outer membrane protein assembly factor BamA
MLLWSMPLFATMTPNYGIYLPILPTLPTDPAANELTSEYLEKHDAVIGLVTIDNQNIFDLQDPDENKWLYRLANGIHATTRTGVVESQLLFEPGAEFSYRQVKETERLLRQNRYIGEADIEYVRFEDGIVDVNVRTKDVWTLKADLALGRAGGVNTGGFSIEEHNLFGSGAFLGVEYKSTADRDIASLGYSNTHFRGSDYTLAGQIADNSDGFDHHLTYYKPFVSLDSRRAGGVTFASGERIDTLYDLGEPQAEFAHDSDYFEFSQGWSRGLKNGKTTRVSAGLNYDNHRFSVVPDSELPGAELPDDRQFLYPFIRVDVVEDRFETARNFDQMNKTEDRYLGTRYGAKLGYSPANGVSTDGSLIYAANYQSGIKFDRAETLLAGVALSGRVDGSQSSNTMLSVFATYHKKQSDRRLLFANLTATVGNNLDLDNPVTLGGATGLRGYPLRYQSGTSSAVLTLEQRLFSDWYPFRVFNVGGAVFFDVGRTWGESPTGGENLGLLRDIGFGLRIANARSSVGRMLHIDIAYPLDGDSDIRSVQFLLAAKRGF